ncbi:MAG: ABC transporter permease [Pseudoxanthomonas sp.]
MLIEADVTNGEGLTGEEHAPIARPALAQPVSPGRRVWQRFRQERLGFWSLVVFLLLYGLSLGGELLCNDRPLVARYAGQWFFPVVVDYDETAFGGDLPVSVDYLSPEIIDKFDAPGNFALFPPIRFRYDTIDYHAQLEYLPSPPTGTHWFGTDMGGYDVLSRALYGFRISVTLAIVLAFAGTVIGIVVGATQGYFGGRADLFAQRLIEIWSAMPELYLIIIFASIYDHSLIVLFVLLTLFGWMHLSDYVRAEFLRNRQREYVKAARAMGLSHLQIIWRHILPNSLTPVVTFLPFRMSATIMTMASLDFLGLGAVPPDPSLGLLLLEGKETLSAWWIAVASFSVLALTLLLLAFMGESLRNALKAEGSLATRGVG